LRSLLGGSAKDKAGAKGKAAAPKAEEAKGKVADAIKKAMNATKVDAGKVSRTQQSGPRPQKRRKSAAWPRPGSS
jgi:hypothetical protein